MIDGSAFKGAGISSLYVEDENRHFRVSEDFLLDFEGLSVIRYLGSSVTVTLSRNIEILGPGCFCSCDWLNSLTFESQSKLTRIESNALRACSSLKSLLIPESVKELSKNWALGSSLRQVIFESAISLDMLIERNKVDLSQGFEIKFVDYDCLVDLPG
jgi:hypothetical protein